MMVFNFGQTLALEALVKLAFDTGRANARHPDVEYKDTPVGMAYEDVFYFTANKLYHIKSHEAAEISVQQVVEVMQHWLTDGASPRPPADR